MPTHAELAGQLLNDAATFFKTLAGDNPDISDSMNENATVFEQVSTLISLDPEGQMEGKTNATMAGQLLKDAANFFRMIGEENDAIKDQMMENANIYEYLGEQVIKAPLGEME